MPRPPWAVGAGGWPPGGCCAAPVPNGSAMTMRRPTARPITSSFALVILPPRVFFISTTAPWVSIRLSAGALFACGEKIGDRPQFVRSQAIAKSRHVGLVIDRFRVRDPRLQPFRVVFLATLSEIGTVLRALAVDHV